MAMANKLALFKIPSEGLQQNVAHKLVFFLMKMKKVSVMLKCFVRRQT